MRPTVPPLSSSTGTNTGSQRTFSASSIRAISSFAADRQWRGCGAESMQNLKPAKAKPEAPREASGLERKKEPADVKLSRHLRKPGKRNGAGFF